MGGGGGGWGRGRGREGGGGGGGGGRAHLGSHLPSLIIIYMSNIEANDKNLLS